MIEITVRSPFGPTALYRFDRDAITIGRAEGCDLVLRDPALSRTHAEVRREGDGWVVADRKSRHGTLLNGLTVSSPRRLADGDEVALGRTILVFAVMRHRFGAGAERETASQNLDRPGTVAGVPERVLVGDSAAIREVRDAVARAAASDSTVLITGESGTGKEMVARLLHRLSARAASPFVVVNCPALPSSLIEAELFGVERGVATGVEARSGRFESARGGTVLLDEVGDLELAAQAKVLRVLEERTVERLGGLKPLKLDVRILAATHHDLEADIARGSFRRDLYHRLAVLAIDLPPLRARREDIPLLVDHFLIRAARPLDLHPDALDLVLRYDYPGNVRELRHALERAAHVARGPAITASDLPPAIRGIAAGAGTAAPEAAGMGVAVPAALLYERIVHGGESFWDVVQRPFLRREVSREEARKLVRKAYEEGGQTYRGVARLFRIEGEYQRLFGFLKNHGLRVRD